jgi:tRNA pseudouridine13 synthase
MSNIYLTSDLEGIGGRIKTDPADFIVEEIPLYPSSGVGEHCYVLIEKRGISTLEVRNLLARALGRKSVDIGYAGLKDAQAVTRQTFSIFGEASDRMRALELPHVSILGISRHRNKLKIGHLAGNRFIIKIRHDDWTARGGSVTDSLRRAEEILRRVVKSGVPNFFGPQRFGMRGDNHVLGLALLRGQAKEFFDRWLGDPDPRYDHGSVLQARQHYAKGRLDLALANWPGHLRDERRALSMLAKKPDQYDKAIHGVDATLKRLLVSALQAHLFNLTLEKRLARLDRILPGDLAWLHDNGAVFLVGPTEANAAAEQPRCDANEISPSGPMFGYRMTEPEGEPATMEAAVLSANDLTPESFRRPQAEKSKGSRRAMRFFPTDSDLSAGTDQRGPYIQISFSLPPGSFATVLLAEIMKNDVGSAD